MADELIPLLSGLGNYPRRLVDKGDGSWAERVDATLSIGAAPVSATNALPMIDAYQAPVSTTWSTATTANSAATFVTNGYDTVIVSLVASAAFAAGVVAFEVFDGTNWLPTKAASIQNYTTTGATIVPTAGSASGYQIPVAGFPQFRVRLASAMTAGTLGIVTIISSAPDTSLVTVGLDPAQPLPGGTNTIGAVIPAYLAPQAWNGAAIDMRAYGTVTITCTVAPSAGTVSVSPDNASNYIGQTLVVNNAAGITTTPSITMAGVYTLSGRAWVQGAFTGGTCFISGGQ